MNSESESTCPKCQAPIPKEAPRGLCPRCLMDGALESEPQAPASPPPKIEELAGAFPQLEVLELLGSGGMGRVYKARQTHLDRVVALKVLPPALAKDPAFAERFAREARALARLNHPNIVQLYDFGQSAPAQDGSAYFYLLLEYVDGVNLRQTLQTKALTSREALGIVPRLCDALHYAHEQGVMHRDIKPENILIDKAGRVKIADFGLARLQRNEGDTEAMTLTMSGAQLGTAAYMAPEQIEQPHEVDHRADIYSLGVVFYELLTGELPLGRFAAPSEKSGVDPRLDSVVFRTLEKQRDRRYQSAGEVQTQVETIAGTPTPSQTAAFSSTEPEENPNALKTGSAIAFPSSWMMPFPWIWRQPFLFVRGTLAVDAERLVYASAQSTLTIPLEAIEDVSLTPMRFAREPLGRCPFAVRWRDATGRGQTTCFLTGSASWLTPITEEQTLTDDWLRLIREAVAKRRGQAPACQHDPALKCADLTPPLPAAPIAWSMGSAIVGFVAMLMILSGNVLVGLPLAAVAAAVGCGIWRRREAKTSTPFSSQSPPPSMPHTQKSASVSGEREPGFSGLAIVALAFAMLGWLPIIDELVFDGFFRSASSLSVNAMEMLIAGAPIIGSVLGWISLYRINRAEPRPKGRRCALFAALQAPVIAVTWLLGVAAFLQWEAGFHIAPLTFTILLLTALVFLLIRILFYMAGLRGLSSWKWWLGTGTSALAVLLLTLSAWVLNGGHERGWGSARMTGESSQIFPVVAETWKSKEARYDEEVYLLFVSVGCASGLLLAASGSGTGTVGLLLATAACVGLQAARVPCPFSEHLQREWTDQPERHYRRVPPDAIHEFRL